MTPTLVDAEIRLSFEKKSVSLFHLHKGWISENARLLVKLVFAYLSGRIKISGNLAICEIWIFFKKKLYHIFINLIVLN